MNKSTETEIAVLKNQTKVFDRDLTEVKVTLSSMDGKLEEIRSLLSEQYVTKKEFDAYRKAQNINKILIGVISAVFTAMITAEIMEKIIK
jgi:hypothetical protein